MALSINILHAGESGSGNCNAWGWFRKSHLWTIWRSQSEGAKESFAGFAIKEIEVPVVAKGEDKGWVTGYELEPATEAKSVASVVVIGKKIDLAVMVAGL